MIPSPVLLSYVPLTECVAMEKYAPVSGVSSLKNSGLYTRETLSQFSTMKVRPFYFAVFLIIIIEVRNEFVHQFLAFNKTKYGKIMMIDDIG